MIEGWWAVRRCRKPSPLANLDESRAAYSALFFEGEFEDLIPPDEDGLPGFDVERGVAGSIVEP